MRFCTQIGYTQTAETSGKIGPEDWTNSKQPKEQGSSKKTGPLAPLQFSTIPGHQEITTAPKGRFNHRHSAVAHVKQVAHGDGSRWTPRSMRQPAKTVGQVSKSDDANARKIAGDG